MVNQQTGQRYRIQLRKMVLTLFDRDELITLCFDLGLQYDDLRGETRVSKVRELISYLARNDRVLELIDYCQTERPHEKGKWQEIAETARQKPAVFLTTPLDQSGVGAEKSNMAGCGIALLIRLIQSPSIQDDVVEFQKDFEVARTKINTVNHYKQLHDLFQEMESSYDLLAQDRERLHEDHSAWDGLDVNCIVLDDAIDQIVTVASDPIYFKQIGPWYNYLKRGQETLHEAIEQRDVRGMDAALRRLYRSLDLGLPGVNNLLVSAVVDLPLDNLVTAMTTVHQNLSSQPELDPETLQQFEASVDALAELADNLTELVLDHNGWQGLADELRRVEANLGNDIFEIELAWPDIKDMGETLYGQNTESWAKSMRRLEGVLEKRLKSRVTAVNINVTFQSYRIQAYRHFRKVDVTLLRLCQNLQNIGTPLDLLLRTIR